MAGALPQQTADSNTPHYSLYQVQGKSYRLVGLCFRKEGVGEDVLAFVSLFVINFPLLQSHQCTVNKGQVGKEIHRVSSHGPTARGLLVYIHKAETLFMWPSGSVAA